ncbi:hypothetical protein JTB14_030602 [Gonioctena quinquepunctata]|nr:hypothetical protein JTB14_030602 [Gonioctena quinquepunctata]
MAETGDETLEKTNKENQGKTEFSKETISETSDIPESSPEDDPKKTSSGLVTEDTEDSVPAEYTFSPMDLLSAVYHNKYYWSIFKSTVMFLVALKMARECYMMNIPMKEYKPFNRCTHFF